MPLSHRKQVLPANRPCEGRCVLWRLFAIAVLSSLACVVASVSAGEPAQKETAQQETAQKQNDAKPVAASALPSVAEIQTRIAAEYPALEALYHHWHAHPELSLQEKNTAARLAAELRSLNIDVTENVGGFGVVGVLRNGDGPTLMIRADMDALPIVERTELPYASRVKAIDRDGKEVGVMHACGHDINMTCLVGTAKLLTRWKSHWSGTIVFVGQPAEEIGAGARAMIADGLFTRFPKPTRALALHCDARYPHGMVNYREGQMQAHVDSVDITVKGKGGHGAAPHTTIDPVLLASRIVVDLQSIVSREVNPLESAVVTVGSIHGGTKHNIIPEEVKLQLTVRTTHDELRKQVLEAIARIARAAAQGARAPEPLVKHDPLAYTPALVNDPKTTRQVVRVLRGALGEARVVERPMSLGGEDFSQFVLAGIPGCYFFVGTANPEQVARAKQGGLPLPLTHTDRYAPVAEPTIKTGVLAMTTAVLDLLKRPESTD